MCFSEMLFLTCFLAAWGKAYTQLHFGPISKHTALLLNKKQAWKIAKGKITNPSIFPKLFLGIFFSLKDFVMYNQQKIPNSEYDFLRSTISCPRFLKLFSGNVYTIINKHTVQMHASFITLNYSGTDCHLKYSACFHLDCVLGHDDESCQHA